MADGPAHALRGCGGCGAGTALRCGPVRLRAHHLLCLLTWQGRGYTPAFTARFDAVVARIARGAAVLLREGPDAVCAPLAADPRAHCHGAGVRARDRAALRDLRALGLLRGGSTLRLPAARLAALRRAFVSGRARSACGGCPWSALCTRTAARGFAAARLVPGPRRPRGTAPEPRRAARGHADGG